MGRTAIETAFLGIAVHLECQTSGGGPTARTIARTAGNNRARPCARPSKGAGWATGPSGERTEVAMSMIEDAELYASLDPLFADQYRAERLLFALATDLRHVRVEEATRALHLRALELKRVVARWPKDRPEHEARRALCDEVLALHGQTRGHVPSSHR